MKKILYLVFVIPIVIILCSCSNDNVNDSMSFNSASTKEETQKVSKVERISIDKVLFDNGEIVVSLDSYEIREVEDRIYVNYCVKNDSKKEIRVGFSNSYVNDCMVSTAGNLTVIPNKRGADHFFYTNLNKKYNIGKVYCFGGTLIVEEKETWSRINGDGTDFEITIKE